MLVPLKLVTGEGAGGAVSQHYITAQTSEINMLVSLMFSMLQGIFLQSYSRTSVARTLMARLPWMF